MSEKKKGYEEKRSPDEDPDFYVRTLAATWGHLDLVRDWLQHHEHEPGKVTENVLFPAAMYGQLEVLGHAIPFGDLYRIDTSVDYPGWTLMHFAVEGAERNYIIPEQAQMDPNLPRRNPGIVSGVTQPKTPEEVFWNQMDIIMKLAESGVPLAIRDKVGHTASFRACHELAVDFVQGGILLDILALLKAGENPKVPQVDTPGLSLGKLPGEQGWMKAVQQVVEWAYFRKHYKILRFCHQRRIMDLTSPKLILTSPQLVLRNYNHPLLMDGIRKGDYELIRLVLEPMPRGSTCSPQDILTRVYEYEFGNTGKRRESILSFACSKYFEGNGNDSILSSLLSPRVVGSHITNITLAGVALRRLPIVLFHENLKSLDVRENNLDSLPSNDSTGDRSMLNWNCPTLQVLNISQNLFTALHVDLFNLPHLNRLLAAGNKIQEVSKDMWTAPALQHLDLDDNLIASLPCPATVPRQGIVRLSAFFATSPSLHLEDTVVLPSTRQAYVNFEAQSSEELHKTQSGFCLKTLYLNGNQLTEIPRGLPCLAPLLHTLKVARNRITDLGYTSDYPALLQTLDAMNNSIARGIQPSLHLPEFHCVQSHLVNTSFQCSHFNHYKMTNLKFLYLSGNYLKDLQIELTETDLEVSNQSVRFEDITFKSEMLFPRLQGLRLTNNCLTRVPESIHKLEKLCELQIEDNPNIRRLPLNLYHLSGLFTFKFDGIGDPIIHELKRINTSTADVLYYLRALETEASQNTSMRLFIIGHFHKGKTTLLASLRGRRAESSFDQRVKRVLEGNESLKLTQEEKASTVGIECEKWVCSKRHGAPRNALKITFYTWDFAGQEEYYLTHQCFLTNRALFVLVWNVLDGDDGIESISIWLQNLQAKAPRSTVVVVGTHLDEIPRAQRDNKCKIWRDKLEKYRIGRHHSKAYPRIKDVHFVGCPPKGKPIHVEALNDLLYDVAMDMDAPRDFSGRIPSSLKIKILQEQIPKSYANLGRRIEVLAEQARIKRGPPALHKEQFCREVGDIIPGAEETESAVDFLHSSTGVVLHFKIPALTDYYIIDPQHWFDLCALVISPENVSKLVTRSIGRDPNCGLLSCKKMDQEFQSRGYHSKTSKLIRTFLHEYHVIHQINHELCLVPSAINPDPLPLDKQQGVFPFSHPPPSCRDDLTSFPSIMPFVLNKKSNGNAMQVRTTGLLYRRLLLLPPIASGFWSKLIALFIQKNDFQKIVLGSTPGNFSLQQGSAYRLLCMIGNLTLEWQYCKTGIMLILEDELLLRVNGLRSHEFEDPQERVVLSDTQDKLRYFHFKGNAGWQFVPSHFTEVIEVVVPEVYIITQQEVDTHSQNSNPSSAKILTKALEMIDEVLKNHCEHLANAGIYAVNDLLHVVPCPLCYGDTDNRHTDHETLMDSLEDTLDVPLMSINPALMALRGDETPPAMEDSTEVQQRPLENGILTPTIDQQDSVYVFTVDDCIKQTFISDYIDCPVHGKLESQYLVPDLVNVLVPTSGMGYIGRFRPESFQFRYQEIVFSDLADVRLDKRHLSAPIDRNEEPDAAGSFGVVVKRFFHEADRGETEVAVKIFDRYDDTSCDSSTELTKNYSDMRYELNKLSSLHHPHIVRFIGVFTNPHCFVLEWAPQKTLEHVRQNHVEKSAKICTTSTFLVLLQVTNALIYLHENVGIVHRDLKLSNVLVFRFPELDHACYDGRGEDAQTCTSCFPSEQNSSVLLKLTDMGICANPAGYRAKDNTGIRQFVPECITSDTLASLTEKVDIFALGSCLYELMTLRGLPPYEISEIEYKNMLQNGKRPQFYKKDTPYPLLLFQFLEECWRHKHFKRPSAEDLNRALQILTGMSVRADSEVVECVPRKLLMDTFVLHQSNRVSASHAIATHDSFSICAALSSPDGSTTAVAVVDYQYPDARTELQMSTLGELKNSHVSALHMTVNKDVLVGCTDGLLILFDSTGTRSISDPASLCSGGCKHEEIVGLHYDIEGKLLLIGFGSGRVHIKNCTQGIRNSLFCQSRDFCTSISNGLHLYALECVSSECSSTLDVWCGSEGGRIEVWSLPKRDNLTWTDDVVAQHRQSARVPVGNPAGYDEGMVVQQMKRGTGLCETMMVALLHKQSTTVIAFVDMASKKIEKTVQCHHSIASFTLSPTKLVIGTYEGSIYLYDTMKLLNSESDMQTLRSQPVEELNGHCYTVYSVLCLKGHINTDGTTSLFPTFMGQASEPAPKDFLVSIGFGKGSQELRKVFKGSVLQHGTHLNAWLL